MYQNWNRVALVRNAISTILSPLNEIGATTSFRMVHNDRYFGREKVVESATVDFKRSIQPFYPFKNFFVISPYDNQEPSLILFCQRDMREGYSGWLQTRFDKAYIQIPMGAENTPDDWTIELPPEARGEISDENWATRLPRLKIATLFARFFEDVTSAKIEYLISQGVRSLTSRPETSSAPAALKKTLEHH